MASRREIDEIRKKIDRMDRELLQLLNERARTALLVGKIKRSEGESAYTPAREKELSERLVAENPGPLGGEAVRTIFREIVSASRDLEAPLRVAYFGPEATNTHRAALQQFGSSTELRPRPSIEDVFAEVERRGAEYGVVPVENSSEGVVQHTLDTFIESSLAICAEILVEIVHDLLSKSRDLDQLKSVYSHPQAIAQCRQWLARHLPNVDLRETASTAEAARKAATEPRAAAVAGRMAADLYDLPTLVSGIQDRRVNLTRFFVIGAESSPPTGDDLTSILFSIKKDEVGALYHAIEPFVENRVNLAKIESRPMPSKLWEYIFFVDLEGHMDEEGVRHALEAVRAKCFFLKVLGSYPKARWPAAAQE